jgi:hypothetical protein
MSKVLKNLVALRPWVARIDDERCRSDLIYITLGKGFGFSDDPNCSVRGFRSITDVCDGTRKSDVVLKVVAIQRQQLFQ